MNVYVIVEGERTEKEVYESWIPLINPQLTFAPRFEDVNHNHYFIEGGGGFPYLYDVIEGAVANVATSQLHGQQLFDRLVIAVDSEDMTLAERYAEINQRVFDQCNRNQWIISYHIVVQHFCFEAWALGNQRLIRGNVSDPQLRGYIRRYNVSTSDPEFLPALPQEELNRANHAKKYLKLLFNARFPKQGYSSLNPGPLLHPNYFSQLTARRQNTGHIDSFGAMLLAFV